MTPQPPPERSRDGSGAPPSADGRTAAAHARADRLRRYVPAGPSRRGHRAWFRQLPARLAAVVVFLVAVTTLLGNLLELRERSHEALAPAAAPTPAPEPAAAATAGTTAGERDPASPGTVRLRVALDRIAVQDDGSPGTTDWRFVVEADGQPLFAFGQDDLDDTGGRNVVRPKEAGAALRAAAGHRPQLSVKGWRLSRFRLQQGAPDAEGEGIVEPGGGEAAIRVAAREGAVGAFVFYFSADPE